MVVATRQPSVESELAHWVTEMEMSGAVVSAGVDAGGGDGSVFGVLAPLRGGGGGAGSTGFNGGGGAGFSPGGAIAPVGGVAGASCGAAGGAALGVTAFGVCGVSCGTGKAEFDFLFASDSFKAVS